jgi:nicotinate-nucleotide adenylyltransferase
MMKVGLLFGSFNPVHIGHMAVANFFAEFTPLDQVWMVVSPHNPLKPPGSLLQDYHRASLVQLAIGDYSKIKLSKVEFTLPRPSYTIHTLIHLSENFPGYSFVLLMGSDSLETLPKWKNYHRILDDYQIYVYPRPSFTGGELKNHSKVSWHEAPRIEISSSFIRESLKQGKDVRFMLPEPVWREIDELNFYRK